MTELTAYLGLRDDSSTPYYPQANGQVELIKKVLITMLQQIIKKRKRDRHIMLFSDLWAYRTSVKTTTGFTPFLMLYFLDVTLSIGCEISLLKLAIELLPDTSHK